MSAEIDWDIEVGAWLRDVPYMWRSYPPNPKAPGWTNHGRIYLFKTIYGLQLLEQKKSDIDGTHVLPMKKDDCSWDVIRYFMVQYYWIGRDLKNIRINGYPVHIPLKYLSNESYLTISGLYDLIGVSPPSTQDIEFWESNLLVKFTDNRPPPIFLDVIMPEKHISKSKHDDFELKKRESRGIHIMFWYLQHVGKYPGVCMPVLTGDYTDMTNITNAVIFPIFVRKEDFSEFQISNLIQINILSRIVKLCMKTKKINRIVIPIAWQYLWKETAHANFLLIDKTVVNPDGSLNIYIFDPWGEPEYSKTIEALPNIIEKLGIGDKQGYKWKYHESIDWCPIYSFQKLEHENPEFKRIGDYEGFCVAWSLWVLELLLLNPGKPYKSVIRSAINSISKESPDFKSFIREYAYSIEEYGEMMKKKLSIEFKTPPKGSSKSRGPFSMKDRSSFSKYIDKIHRAHIKEIES